MNWSSDEEFSSEENEDGEDVDEESSEDENEDGEDEDEDVDDAFPHQSQKQKTEEKQPAWEDEDDTEALRFVSLMYGQKVVTYWIVKRRWIWFKS